MLSCQLVLNYLSLYGKVGMFSAISQTLITYADPEGGG